LRWEPNQRSYCMNAELDPTASSPRTNRLATATSPYLRAHASNPVEWYPWGDEAVQRARQEDKPIFLSIGYSTCHWCHVMAKESFEDPETAAILNRYFVPVKVDREERPDVDLIYMGWVQATTGQGGWPLHVWLTPEGTPFFGGTYFPPEDRWGLPSFRRLLLRLAELWIHDRARLRAAAKEMRESVQSSLPVSGVLPEAKSLLENAVQQLARVFDPRHGGFGHAPKFPQPVLLELLWRSAAHTGARAPRHMALATLDAIARGGIHDHLGGGFHRYSVDERWQVPHFEKMLDDQAQLAMAFLRAYQVQRTPRWASVARRIFEYVRRRLTGPEGRFYGAEDADSPRPDRPSEHGEGAVYLWTFEEVVSVLEAEEAACVVRRFGIRPEGNIPPRCDPHGELTGRNVLAEQASVEQIAQELGWSPEVVQARLEAALQKLFERRQQRPQPAVDDATVLSSSSLMISAFVMGAQVLGDDTAQEAAERAAHFIETQMTDPTSGVPWRYYAQGRAHTPPVASDLAFWIQACLDLYELDFDVSHLRRALQLQSELDRRFAAPNGAYYDTPPDDPLLPWPVQQFADGARPSANGVAARNLIRLSRLLNDPQLEQRALRIVSAASDLLREHPSAAAALLDTLDMAQRPPRFVVVRGRIRDPDTRAWLREVYVRWIPDRTLMLADGGEAHAGLAIPAEWLREIDMTSEGPRGWICEHAACQPPARTLDEWREQLDTLAVRG